MLCKARGYIARQDAEGRMEQVNQNLLQGVAVLRHQHRAQEHNKDQAKNGALAVGS